MMKAKNVCPAPVVVSDYFFKQLTEPSLLEINAPKGNDERQHDKNEKPSEEEWQCNWKCAPVTNNSDVNHVLASEHTPLFYKKYMNDVLSRENITINELETEVNEMWERVKEVQEGNAERRAFFSRFTNSSSSSNTTTKDQSENDGKENIVEKLREQIQKHYTMWTSHVIAERFNLQLSCNTSEQLQEALKEVKQSEFSKQEQKQEGKKGSNANRKMNNSSDLHIAVHFRAIDKNSSSSKHDCTNEEQGEYQEHTEESKAVTQPLRLRRLFTPLLQRSRDEFATNLSLLFGQLQTFQRNRLSELQSKLSQCTMFDIPLHVVFDHIAMYIQRTLCPLSQNDYDHTVKEQTRLLQAITQMQNKRECFLLDSAHESAAHCNNNHDTLHKWSTVLDQYNTTHVSKNSCNNNKNNDNTNVVSANKFNNTTNKAENGDNNNTDNVENYEECKTVFSELPLSERYSLAEEMWQQLFSELDARKVFHAEGVNTFHEMYNSGKVKHNTMLEELHTCDKVTQAQLEQLQKEANECGRVITRIGNELTPVIDEANSTYAVEFANLQNALNAKSNMLMKSEKEQERLARRVREAVKDLYKEQVKYASLSQEMLQDQLTQVQLTESYHSLSSALTTCKDDAENSHKVMTEVHHLLEEAETRRQELIEMCENHITRLTHDHYYTCGQLASLAERNCTQWEKCVQSVLELYQRRFEKLSRSGTQTWQMEYLVSNEREFAVENLLDVRDEYAKYTHAWKHDMTTIFDMLNNSENNNSGHTKTHKKCNEDDDKNKANYNAVNDKQIITQDVQRSLAQTHLVDKHNALQTVNDAENKHLQTKQNKFNKSLEENAKDNKLQRIMEEIDGHWRVQRANTTLRKHNKLCEKQKHDKENYIVNTEESSKAGSDIENTALNDKELKLDKGCNVGKSILSTAAAAIAAGSGATAAVNLSKAGSDVKK